MTGNAYQRILPARYLRQNEDGDIVEDQEDLFERVAKNVALAEAVYAAQREGEAVLVEPEDVKPNHSNREELVEEVFGEDVSLGDNVKAELTERNVSKFAYDTVVPKLDGAVRDAVVETREDFQEAMERLSFIPNSPTLMNAGDELQQLSACFVDSPGDDMQDIHETAKEAAEVFQSGGGMGYAFWKLRPYGDPVGSTGGIASGPITFMRTFDQMCFVPGTKILTPEGNLPIEEIEEGDTVIDENGDEQRVTGTMERHVDEEIVEVEPERLNKNLRVTHEHPFKVARDDGFEWVDAGDLREGDRLVLGNANYENDLTLGDTASVPEIASGAFVFTDGGVRLNREYYGASKGHTPATFADEVPVSDFATIAGWYLAEGCVVYRRGIPNEVVFTLNNDEDDSINEIRDAVEPFGLSVRVEEVEERNTAHVHVENASFAEFVEGMFGTGASEKSVPEILWNAPVETQARVLEALFAGDGRLEKRGDSQRAQLKLANEEIIDFTFQAGLRCGVQFSRHDREPEGNKPTYSVSVSISTVLGTPLENIFDVDEVPDDFSARDRTKQAHGREVVEVDSVETAEYEGPVYNAEVADTHTYVAEDIVVHNCETIAQGGTRRGAQMGVMRVSHPDVIQFIHAKNKDVSLAHTLRLNDPDDYTHTSFTEALDEARELIDDEGRVPEHLRNAAEGHLSNFNISVGVSHDFMEALENGEDFTFTNPRTEEPHIATQQTKELYDRFGLGEHVEVGEELSVPAEEIWERMLEGAYENGEPGVIYLDRVNDEHSFDVEEYPDHEILATNPCVTGDTLISTENGLVPAEELYESGVATDVVVDGRLSDDTVKEASSVYKTGEKDVYKMTTQEGYDIRLTADHRVMTDEGWVEAGELDEGDTVHIQNRKGEFGSHGTAAEGRVLGWLVGDGHLKNGEERALLNFYDEDTTVSEKFVEDVNQAVREPTGNADYEIGVSEISRGDDCRGSGALEQRVRSERLYEVAEEAGLTEEKLTVPDAVMRGSKEMARGFLKALFSADGSVQGSAEKGVSVRLTSVDAGMLKDVQRLLLNFGIFSKLYEERHEAGAKELPDGNGGTKEYEVQADHDLVISKDSLVSFRDEVGFLLDEKNEALDVKLAGCDRGPYADGFEATVESVEHDGHEAVYDLTEPDTHSFVGNGIVVHNCGEQPLEEYEACNLGHINLSTLVAGDSPDWRDWYEVNGDDYGALEDAVAAFLDEALDWDEFNRRIDVGTRFLENVVTMSDFPIDEIEEKVAEMRKIGLGIMGLAQMYVQTGVRYGSDEANEVARQIMRHINHESKRTSHDLARERGVFDEWHKSKFANPTEHKEWFEKQTGESADDWEDGYPVRNHNTTTIAPTGCVDEGSLISTDEGLRPIKALDNTGAEFDQWGEIEEGVATDGGTKTATAVYDNGFADVRRIQTEGGFSVAATPNHRFRTLTEDGEYTWKEADDFETGDSIVLQRNTFEGGTRSLLDTSERENYYHNTDEDLELPDEMSPELAEFLGYFMGDGYVHDEVGVKLVVGSDAEELDEYLRELSESVFGVAPTVEDRDTRHTLIFGGRHLPRYFDDNGWKKEDGNNGEGAASAFVPDEVLSSDEDCAKAFLRGLFEADGTASRKVELSTVSPKLAEQVQTLLLSLGTVFVRDRQETDDMDGHYGDRPRYALRGANRREDKRFADEIGFLMKSTEFELTTQSYKNDTYPPAVVEKLRGLDGYEDVSEETKHRVNQSPINGSVTRKLVRDVEEETGETVRIDGRRLTEFYAAPIESVTEEKAYTKDISVPSNNTYVANGFVTHNTTSMIGNTTGGCEPIYNVAYYKNVSDDVQGDEMLVEFDDYFLRVLEENDLDIEAVKEEAKEQMANNEFDGVEGLETVPDKIGELFVTTGDLSAKEHAAVQCACQEGVDSAISKTVNAPNDSTVEDAKEVFEFIYKNGGKGVTYYRDGTRSKQVLTTRADNKESADDVDPVEEVRDMLEEGEITVDELTDGVVGVDASDVDTVEAEADGGSETSTTSDGAPSADRSDAPQTAETNAVTPPSRTEEFEPRPRPDTIKGATQKVETGYGGLYVTINEDDNGMFEVFARIGKSGGYTASFTEAIARLSSLCLRSGIPPEQVVEQLEGIRSPKVTFDRGEQVHSVPDAIAKAMTRYIQGETAPQQARLPVQGEEDDEEDEKPVAESDGGATATASGGAGDVQQIIDEGRNPECPDCGSMLVYTEGCVKCNDCGYSEC